MISFLCVIIIIIYHTSTIKNDHNYKNSIIETGTLIRKVLFLRLQVCVCILQRLKYASL